MHTQLIPAEQWSYFVNEFSREYAGWPVTIEMLDGVHGTQKAAENLALHGLSFDTKGTRPSSLHISLGGDEAAHIDHVVELPLNIRTMEDHLGNIHVQIEPASGPPTLLHLRAPLH